MKNPWLLGVLMIVCIACDPAYTIPEKVVQEGDAIRFVFEKDYTLMNLRVRDPHTKQELVWDIDCPEPGLTITPGISIRFGEIPEGCAQTFPDANSRVTEFNSLKRGREYCVSPWVKKPAGINGNCFVYE